MTMLMTLTVMLLQPQRAGEHADQQHAGDDADAASPRPPKIETPPSSTAAMTWSSRPVRVVAAGAAEAQREEDAGERRDRAGEDEEPELGARDVDAGEVRGLGVQADLVDAAAERREVQQQREDDGQHDERDHDDRDSWWSPICSLGQVASTSAGSR